MAKFTEDQVMLTLAGLTYRGFQDVLGGSLHEEIVSGAVFDGLQTLAPVKDEWDLIWGPATDRDRGLAIDTNMMYVARSLSAPNRLVVAIRGTNPLSLPDWVFGDFWVGETVAWPYATAAESAVVSKSTALGLAALQSMRSRKPATSTIAQVSARVTRALTTLGRAARGGPADLLAATPARFEAQVKRIGELWQDAAANATPFEARRQAADARPIAPAALRPKLAADAGSDDRSDLLTLLRAEAKESGATALEVVVTGHSKGGALAASGRAVAQGRARFGGSAGDLGSEPARNGRMLRVRGADARQRGLRAAHRTSSRQALSPPAQHERHRDPRLAGRRAS